MTEEELARAVAELCRRLEIRSFRVPRVRLATAGFPDLVLWGSKRLIFRELKSARGRVSLVQSAVGSSLIAAGQDWGVWRPHHLEVGVVEEELRGLHHDWTWP